MPDTPVEPSSPRSYPPDMESRVAVLEQIARARLSRRWNASIAAFDQMAAEHRADFRWLLGIMLAGFGTLIGMMSGMLGVIAHGFHWL